MGSKSRSSSSQSTSNSSITSGIQGDNDGVVLNGQDLLYQHDDSETFNTDNSYTDSSNEQIYTDSSYKDTSTSYVDESYYHHDASVDNYDYSDRSTTNISYVDAGAIAAAENISANAMITLQNASAVSASMVERALDNSALAIDGNKDVAELAIMENTNLANGYGHALAGAYQSMGVDLTNITAQLSNDNVQVLSDAGSRMQHVTDAALAANQSVHESSNALVSNSINHLLSVSESQNQSDNALIASVVDDSQDLITGALATFSDGYQALLNTQAAATDSALEVAGNVALDDSSEAAIKIMKYVSIAAAVAAAAAAVRGRK